MTTVQAALPRIVADLRDLDPPWALVGGLAVCARARPRPTADIDIAVAVPDDVTANACVDRLLSVGYRSRESIVHEQTGRLATVRLLSPFAGIDVPVDLFFASAGVEAEIVEAADRVDVAPGLTIPVASIGHLIAVKLLWRPSTKRDRDLRTLIDCATDQDLDDARWLITVITERGHHRGRDLEAALESWLVPPATGS